MKTILILVAFMCGYSSFASDPTISNVTVRQRWPWSKLVDIDYVLTCDKTKPVDIMVNGFNGVTKLALSGASLSGDLHNMTSGAHRIIWDPTVTACTNIGALGKFRVELTPRPVPLYMIVDLTKDEEPEDQIEYVYEVDLRTNKWGSWIENPVTNRGDVIHSVVWTGVTNDSIYATDKLVLRRIPAGSYTMGGDGYSSYPATFTKDFYASVFTVTDAQWNMIMEASGSGTSQPKISISYNDIRGATNSLPPIDWPTTGSEVSAASFLGQLRGMTGFSDFDLPTEAQWEYLCRAETTTVFNDGNADARYGGSIENNNGTRNDYLNALGWYKYNCSGYQPVGLKTANAWGIYDTHGNVWQWCLDWYDSSISDSILSGPLSGSTRVMRGGRWISSARVCRSASRASNDPARNQDGVGIRLVRNLP